MSRLRNGTKADISVNDWNRLRKEVQTKKDFRPYVYEEIVLSSGQTTVSMLTVSTQAEFYIFGPDADNGKLAKSSYTVVNESTIELQESFPAGTILIGEQNAV